MAEEKKSKKSEEEEVPPAVTPAPSNKKKVILLVAGLIVLLLLIGIPVVLFTLSGNSKDGEQVEKLEKDAAKEREELVLMLEGFEEEDESNDAEKPLGAFYPFETFVINLSGGGYLRLQVQVEFATRDIPKKFFAKLIPIRDGLINLLANKSRRDLSDEKGRADLKSEIRDSINEKLRKQEIERVYFTQFVIQ